MRASRVQPQPGRSTSCQQQPFLPRETDTAPLEARGRGHIGLIVLGSIASGLVLGLVLVLGVFGGGTEAQITGGALIALGVGFSLLAVASTRFTDQPQHWALTPGIGAAAVGLAVGSRSRQSILRGRRLGVAAPVSDPRCLVDPRRTPLAPELVAPWLLYPALAVLFLMAVGGAFETVAEATSSNVPPAGGRTYLVDGHRLYLNCTGAGGPTVVLFNGLGERTPSWALVQGGLSVSTRTCVFDRAGEGWSGAGPGPPGWPPARGRPPRAPEHSGHRTALCARRALRRRHLRPRLRGALPRQVAGVALIDSSTPYMFDLLPTTKASIRCGVGLGRAPVAFADRPRKITLRSGSGGLPPQARDSARDFAASPREPRGDRNEFLMLPTVFEQAKELTTLDGKPLGSDRRQRHPTRLDGGAEQLAQLSTNSVHRTAHGATHEELLEDRRFATITTQIIRDVVGDSR